MDTDFWLQRWQKNEIGFHRHEFHPLLTRYWRHLGLEPATPVLVPLCGKSRDMLWLREQGHTVTGVELSDNALAQFIQENSLPVTRSNAGYHGDGWNLVAGDWFELELPEPMPAFYDRAALIALPPAMRAAYVEKLLAVLSPGATGLLITLEYRQSDMNGPPFSVLADEVLSLFSGPCHAEELERTDILSSEPRFAEKGLARLQEVAWRIELSPSPRSRHQ